MTEPIKVLNSSSSDSRHAPDAMRQHVSYYGRNKRLFVGSLPKDKTQQDVAVAMKGLVKGVVDVIMYASQQDRNRNRGYAFVEFDSHESAVIAREAMQVSPPKLWDGPEIKVDWAEPENEVDDETMSKVKVLFVRNLAISTNEDALKHMFATYGSIERVKKQNDYAFVHFCDRHDAEAAMTATNNTNLDGSIIEVMWSKPVKNRDQYRQRRGNRMRLNPVISALPLNTFWPAYQRMQNSLLLQQTLQSSAMHLASAHQPANAVHPELLNGFHYQAATLPIGFGAMPPLHPALGAPQQPPQPECFPEDAQRGAPFMQQPLGNAPGAVRASVSPHVHTRPYTVPSSSTLQQPTTQQHLGLQHAVLPLPPQHIPLMHQQYFAAGFELPPLSQAYPPTFAVFPGPSLPYFAAQSSAEYYRPQYQENASL